MSNLMLNNSGFYSEESKEWNSLLLGEMNYAEEGFLKESLTKTSLISKVEIEGLDFLERLKQSAQHKKSTQQTSTEGVYLSSGFKRIRKQIAKVINIQPDLVVLEFIVNKDLGKFQTKNFAPNIFSDINLKLNNFIVFNHFRKGNTFKIEISDNQNLISKEELPDYNFDEFSNLFD